MIELREMDPNVVSELCLSVLLWDTELHAQTTSEQDMMCSPVNLVFLCMANYDKGYIGQEKVEI